jgi:seryl-tRNA synthetase
MLQVNFIRQNRDLVIERLGVKHFKDIALVDTIIVQDDLRKKIQSANDELLSKRNQASKEIGALMGKGLKEEAEAKKGEVASLKNQIELNEQELVRIESELKSWLERIPNLPSIQVQRETLR